MCNPHSYRHHKYLGWATMARSNSQSWIQFMRFRKSSQQLDTISYHQEVGRSGPVQTLRTSGSHSYRATEECGQVTITDIPTLAHCTRETHAHMRCRSRSAAVDYYGVSRMRACSLTLYSPMTPYGVTVFHIYKPIRIYMGVLILMLYYFVQASLTLYQPQETALTLYQP